MMDVVPREEFPTEIFPWLYLGNAQDAVNYDGLRQKGIRFILNATKELHTPEAEEEGFQYLKLNLEDHADEPIADYFEQAFNFIEQARRQSQAVLVHCRRGISRSATIVIAYVMRYARKTFEEAFEYVKQRREIINPNLGFVLALESFSARRAFLDPPTATEERDCYVGRPRDLVLAH
jgi:protein tyrosine/serine phosphatase